MLEERGTAVTETTILVVCETRRGELEALSLSLCGEAFSFSRRLGGAVRVVAFTPETIPEVETLLAPCGARRIMELAESSDSLTNEDIASTVARIARDERVPWIFLAHTQFGEDIGPSLAARLEAGMVSACVELEPDQGQRFTALQSIQDGRLYQEVGLDDTRTRVISWDASALSSYREIVGNHAEVVSVSPSYAPRSNVKVIRRIKGDPRELPLHESDRILVMGRGMAPDGMALIQKSAERLGAGVGATRPIIDAQLAPFEKQIGQTGVNVAPRLIITCGVSGANEFTVGMADSHSVVAMNTDPLARIFQFSDLGLVGDAHETLEEFLKLMDELDSHGKPDGGEAQ